MDLKRPEVVVGYMHCSGDDSLPMASPASSHSYQGAGKPGSSKVDTDLRESSGNAGTAAGTHSYLKRMI